VPTSNTISFGGYNPLNASPPLDGTGSFVIACTDAGGNRNKTTTINYTVKLSGQALRQLAPPSGSDRLNYNLFTDATRSSIWGDGTGGTSSIVGSIAVPGRSTASTAPIAYYGRIVAAQDVSASSPTAPTTYSQSLTMTVTCVVSGVVTAC
jgi:spore coat protein U-like protein